MGKSAGIWKKIKNGVGNFVKGLGDGLQIVSPLAKLVKVPIFNNVLEYGIDSVGDVTSKTGDLIKGDMEAKDFLNYLDDEYRYVNLLNGPINIIKDLFGSSESRSNLLNWGKKVFL